MKHNSFASQSAFAAPALDSDAIRFLSLDKMSEEQFAELESLLSDESAAPLPLGPLTNEERAENFAELLEFFKLKTFQSGASVHFNEQNIQFTGGGNCVANGIEMPVRKAIIAFLACIGRRDLIESVLVDARGFDW